MLIFLYKCIVSGGAETLMMRLGRNIEKEGLAVKIFCTQISDQMKKQYEKYMIQIEVMNKWMLDSVVQNLCEGDIVFTFFLRDFMMCKSYAQEKNKHNQIYLYMIQAKALHMERLSKLGIGKYFIRNRLRNTIYRSIDGGEIIFMDEMCVKWVEKFYHKKIKNPKEKIYRLPMEDIPWDECRFLKTMYSRKDNFQILTIARAHFPFKAYMKGLIENFTILKKEYGQIKLMIVSYGADIGEVKKWINEAYKNGASDIELIGEMRYDQLEDFYEKANLYVGMGTTLLDAAKYGVISLNALMYSYELKTTGFFHEFPYLLEAEEDCQEALEKIREVICYTDNEYEKYARDSRRLAQKNYSIEIFLKRILSQKKEVDHKIPFVMRKIIKLIKSPIE